MTGPNKLIAAVMLAQVLSALVFVFDVWGEILGLRSRPWPWAVTEASQMLATFGLITGVIVTGMLLHQGQQRIRRLDQQISAVSGQYENQLKAMFADWNLSQSEQDITIYAMKGFSNAEIGTFRGTSVSTVKSQMNAIFRKTGFSNRRQLISFLVEEMIDGVEIDRLTPPAGVAPHGDADADPKPAQTRPGDAERLRPALVAVNG